MGLLKNWWIKILFHFKEQSNHTKGSYLTDDIPGLLEKVSLKINDGNFNPYRSDIGNHYTDLRHEDIFSLYKDSYWAFVNIKQKGYLPNKYALYLSPKEAQVLDYLTLDHVKNEYVNPIMTINSSISIWNDFLIWLNQKEHEDKVLIEDSIKPYIEEWVSVYAIILTA